MHATVFRALGEPSRLEIVDLLRTGPLSVGDIADRLDIRQPQVSKHVKVLRTSGVVEVEARGRHHYCGLAAEPFDAIARWVDSFEQLWEQRLDALGEHLRAIERAPHRQEDR